MRDVILYAGERASKRMRAALKKAVCEWDRDNGKVLLESEIDDLVERIRKAMRDVINPQGEHMSSLADLPVAAEGPKLKPLDFTGITDGGYCFHGKMVVYCGCKDWAQQNWDGTHEKLCIANKVKRAMEQAVDEEREACAMIAEKDGTQSFSSDPQRRSDYDSGARAARGTIAFAIWSRGQK